MPGLIAAAARAASQPAAEAVPDRGQRERITPKVCKTRELNSGGAGDNGPVLDAHGNFDLLEFLFPTVPGSRGAVTCARRATQ
jgi:hypothetical protein